MNSFVRYISLLILSVLFFIPCMADETVSPNLPATVEQANSAYKERDYKKAITLYKSVIESKGTSAPLLFNLANCYYFEGDYGHARLYYERARRLSPRNEEINNNLDYVAGKVDDSNVANLESKRRSVKPDPLSFFAQINQSVSNNIRSNTWAVFAAMSFLLTLACIALYLFPSNVNARKVGFFGGFLFLFFDVIFVVFAFMAAKSFDTHDEVVIIDYKVPLLADPSKDSKPSSTPLSRGSKLLIEEKEDNASGEVEWYKVRLNSDFIGWVRATDVEVI